MTDKLDVEAEALPPEKPKTDAEMAARYKAAWENEHRCFEDFAAAKDAELKALREKMSECRCWKDEHCPLHSVGIAIEASKTSAAESRAASLEKERDELRAALSGRTVSCSNCNALQAQLAQAKAEAELETLYQVRDTVAGFATIEGYAPGIVGEMDNMIGRALAKKTLASLRQSVPPSAGETKEYDCLKADPNAEQSCGECAPCQRAAMKCSSAVDGPGAASGEAGSAAKEGGER